MGKVSNTDKIQSRKEYSGVGTMRALRPRHHYWRERMEQVEQPDNTSDGPQLFACPFAQHDPSAVPRSCVLGWQSIARVKEHLGRRHKCSCEKDPSKCAACKTEGLRLNGKASRMLSCRSPDSEGTWTRLYCTIYPKATYIPSPYIKQHESSRKTAEHAVREFSQVLCDGLDDMIRFTLRNHDTALARQLQGYIMSQGERYIESEQYKDMKSSSPDWPDSEQALSEHSLDSRSSNEPTPLLDLGMANAQDMPGVPAHSLLLRPSSEPQWQDLTTTADPYSASQNQPSMTTTNSAPSARAQYGLPAPLLSDYWEIPSASSSSTTGQACLIPDTFPPASFSDSSSNNAIYTTLQLPRTDKFTEEVQSLFSDQYDSSWMNWIWENKTYSYLSTNLQ